MVEADFSGSFTNPENCKEGDIGTIAGEGKFEEKENFKGMKYNQLNMDVTVNNKKLIHSPRIDEGRKLVKIWGKETQQWIGNKFRIKIVNYKSMGITKQCVEIEPILTEKV